jgi:nucleoside phosphorylase
MARAITQPRRPANRDQFEIAIICALPLEADAVEILFDHHWDDAGPSYDKTAGDTNAYSTGAIGRHNVVLAHMPGMGKASAAAVAVNCRNSFPNIRLALVVGVCGVVPFSLSAEERVLGDVIISDGVIQYDFGRQYPEGFSRKDTLLDSLGRPNTEIRSLMSKLRGFRHKKKLQDRMVYYLAEIQKEPALYADYPGASYDKLFEAKYRHINDEQPCDDCGCNGPVEPRRRLEHGNPEPAVHFGLIASGDTVLKSGEDRDRHAQQAEVIGFEMESAGVWDNFPCIVIKGACDYADSHKSKTWQRYAAATAAACMKAFLDGWVPFLSGA